MAKAYSVPVETLDVPSILHFGSWVGGDMDGNPDVHGKTIRETLHRHQQLIVSTYFAGVRPAGGDLEPEREPRRRERRARRTHRFLQRHTAGRPGARAGAPRPHAVPHVLRPNRRAAQGDLRGPARTPTRVPTSCWPTSALAADSLIENRGRHAGYFLVRRFMRRVRTFGFHLATLDVIQHAHVHNEVIAQGLGVADWAAAAGPRSGCGSCAICWRATKAPLRHSMPSAGAACGCSRPSPRRATNIGGRAIGEYIVSGAQGPEDVLAVLLLARWADITDKRSGECAARCGAAAGIASTRLETRRRGAARIAPRARLPAASGSRAAIGRWW